MGETDMCVDGTSVCVEVADPSDPLLEDLLLGDTDDGRELTGAFASLAFALRAEPEDDDPPPTLYRFSNRHTGATVAYAALQEGNWPKDSLANLGETETFLAIELLGVVTDFQRRADPAGSETYSYNVMRAIEELIFPETEEAVGLILLVRDRNRQARKLYRRFGFWAEATGVFPSGLDRLPTRCLRKYVTRT